MIKYNLIDKMKNEGILESIFDATNGKLIIASDNSFAISSILEELKIAAWSGRFELYNGSTKVNPDVTSDNIIIAVCTMMAYSMPKVTPEFSVATLYRESKESFTFDILVLPVSSSLEFSEVATGSLDKSDNVIETEYVKPNSETEIFNSLKAHNVVFVQDLSIKVIEGIKEKRSDIKEINYLNTISDGYTIATDDGVIVIKFDAPDNLSVEYSDCISFIASALKYGVVFVCNTTWVKFFLELTSVVDEINLSSVVVYNNSVFGPMGNTDLYTV